ncbi:MAG: hypothetical protein KatS3mg058_3760 [Roseiflexus sp.]|nr:MAG: hypothetical protein KatS3mg058_3760 [Roseiflexus sp.]
MNLQILSRFALIFTLLALTFGPAGVRPAYAAGYVVNSSRRARSRGCSTC